MNTKKHTNPDTATVAALKRHEIDHATITTTAAASVRWSNFGVPDVVEAFQPGEVLTLESWRPEGMTIRAAGHDDIFAFWRDLEALTAEPTKTTPGAFGDVESDDLSESEQDARRFLVKTGTRFSARYLGDFDKCREWGEDDKGRAGADDGRGDCVPVFRVRISSASGSMVVRFRASVADWRKGRETVGVYDVLACLTKSEPGTFDEFCNEYGFFPINSQADYKRARRTWRGCAREFAGVCRVWPDEAARQEFAEIN